MKHIEFRKTGSVNKDKFPDWPMRFEKLGQGDYCLLSDWRYAADKDRVITVPAGFRFDAASIPKFAWPLVGCPVDSIEAAAVHDWLYYLRTLIFGHMPQLLEYLEIEGDPNSFKNNDILRHWADSVYLHALKDMCVSRANRYAQYRAVRMFGRIPWYSKRHPQGPEIGQMLVQENSQK